MVLDPFGVQYQGDIAKVCDFRKPHCVLDSTEGYEEFLYLAHYKCKIKLVQVHICIFLKAHFFMYPVSANVTHKLINAFEKT